MSPQPQRFYGWTVAITLWFTYLLSVGLPFYGAGVVNAAMAKSLQLDKTTIGFGFSLLSMVWGLTGPLVAALLNRRGLRFTVTLGSLVLAAGAAAMAFLVHERIAFILVFGITIGVGIGIASNLPTQTGITLWFSRKRALVMSLVMTASGVGGFFGPTLLDRIMQLTGDWRAGWQFIVATSLLCAAVAAIFLRDRPSDLGQWPDGIAPDSAATAATGSATASPQWTAAQALRHPVFWQILIVAIIFSAPVPMMVAHGVSHFEALGNAPAVAAWALALMVLFSVPGRVLGGILCDRFPPRLVWALMMLLIAAGIAIATIANSTVLIVLFAALMGIGFGASIICWVAITASYFGPASFATVMGTQTPISMLVISSVPALAGILYDQTGTFTVPLWSSCFAMLAGMVLITFARAPRLRPALAMAN
ncbi:MFS transporter [Massilia cavernae]|uniref:MFS transporter n=1 Tax=Massilia cavernae TaxID=2320864 RepID=UPI001602805C|nr:MFS transporter [Massilia cavernae]